MKVRIIDYTTRLLLLTVYASFFVVQSFFSLNSHFQGADFRSNCRTGHAVQQLTKYFDAKKSDCKQTNVRLNKRFQPEAVLTYADKALPELLSHIQRYKLFNPAGYLLISSILTSSLRGPPLMG